MFATTLHMKRTKLGRCSRRMDTCSKPAEVCGFSHEGELEGALQEECVSTGKESAKARAAL